MKVVIWGHPLHSHTHSYIHEAFHKAFLRMGHDAVWLPNTPNQSIPDDALVITEGQQDSFLPVNPKAKYVLHNCNNAKYKDANVKMLLLQVYTHDVRDRAKDNPAYEKLDRCIYVERASDCTVLYQPWATDLMQDEIDLNKASLHRYRECNWVGTIGGGQFGNDIELKGWQKGCLEFGITFKHHGHVSMEEHRRLVERSWLAPAIVGSWQKEKGYIPCRIFKNISYGQFGLTNSEAVFDIMEEQHVVYMPDSSDLFFNGYHCQEKVEHTKAAMDFVKKKHTYSNRINTILGLI